MRRARIKVALAAALAAVSLIAGAPTWVSRILTLYCVATPLLLGATGGSRLVRAVLLNPQSPPPGYNPRGNQNR
jgi:hypothetical protein